MRLTKLGTISIVYKAPLCLPTLVFPVIQAALLMALVTRRPSPVRAMLEAV